MTMAGEASIPNTAHWLSGPGHTFMRTNFGSKTRLGVFTVEYLANILRNKPYGEVIRSKS